MRQCLRNAIHSLESISCWTIHTPMHLKNERMIFFLNIESIKSRNRVCVQTERFSFACFFEDQTKENRRQYRKFVWLLSFFLVGKQKKIGQSLIFVKKFLLRKLIITMNESQSVNELNKNNNHMFYQILKTTFLFKFSRKQICDHKSWRVYCGLKTKKTEC